MKKVRLRQSRNMLCSDEAMGRLSRRGVTSKQGRAGDSAEECLRRMLKRALCSTEEAEAAAGELAGLWWQVGYRRAACPGPGRKADFLHLQLSG